MKNSRKTNDKSRPITVKDEAKSYSQAMDPRIWSRIPAELLEQILSFLPLKTLLNLRSTSKHFESLVFSPPFVSKHSSDSSPFSSFLLPNHPQCYHDIPLYDSALGTWRKLALPLSDLLPCKTKCFSLLSTSDGLFCFSLPSSSSFLVRNLLARTSRLIKFPIFPFVFELFTLVRTHVGYKLFLICTGSSPTSVFVYDSGALSWRQYDSLDPVMIDNHHQKGVYFDGRLYFTTPEPFSIVSFDLESGKWERPETELPAGITFVRLVSGGGKLYMIGGVGLDGISRSMNLWELDEARNWASVGSLPELMCRKFVSVCYHNYEHVYCFWHQGMICVCCSTWPEILYYKVSRRTWHWLPRCPYFPDEWSCGIKWFSFVPELYAPV